MGKFRRRPGKTRSHDLDKIAVLGGYLGRASDPPPRQDSAESATESPLPLLWDLLTRSLKSSTISCELLARNLAWESPLNQPSPKAVKTGYCTLYSAISRTDSSYTILI
jgi:hypothetical protein